MAARAVGELVEALKRKPSRTWSVVVTLYGDAICPRGGSVWLGTLTDFFHLLGVGEGAVRTAMSRLAADGWLERERSGRNSFYRLTRQGEQTFLSATAEIYRGDVPPWSGGFDALLLPPTGSEAARRNLLQDGFGEAAPGLLVAPPGAPSSRQGEESIRLRLELTTQDAGALAARAWPLDEAAEAYARFYGSFSPLDAALAAGSRLSDAQAIVARTLLIHEYRRIVLRHRRLPAELLPRDWPGHDALRLCRRLYPLLLPGSERWLDRHGKAANGALPPAPLGVGARFLPDAPPALDFAGSNLDIGRNSQTNRPEDQG